MLSLGICLKSRNSHDLSQDSRAGPKEERRESETTYLKISNDPSFAISSGAKLLQPSRIVFVVSLLTSVLLRQSQSC